MEKITPYRIKTIIEYHNILGISKPQHPLISLINLDNFKPVVSKISVVFDFYMISLKRDLTGNINYLYGQQPYDFDQGILFFIAPNQVFSFEADTDFTSTGWMLLIHPDFLWNTALAKNIAKYEYFRYCVNEALHLSQKEETIVENLIKNIEQEYHNNLDKFTETIIITQIETLLTYADRFYNRQFITRKKINHQILNDLEDILIAYFNNDDLLLKGIPTVQFMAEKLAVSPNYLSSVLKVLTGKSTQEHIQDKVIDKAKEKLSTTNLSMSEIAYQLGFEYPQTFGNLFKKKTNLSPLEFRKSFN
ncbi:AraC-like DNA-binding protein [Flavobacterium araucananum]|uniref:AraC family transcriptional regulator n=1 Tax=Flavobacterium araucananum TaxID=946678 RepID=A0A227PCH9_9FLAO|nr:helix-turn-helix transcriptional regulator [Flavobacterium araucananum]OXG07074.1 AraC family transcriptional regulator [Flavobacterium araucananum]PWJ97501.1 AraC-like DNA-binding protein [Flavobacterium araucananum]